jgi:hypothetical protein
VVPFGADLIDETALFNLDLDDLFRIKAKIDGRIVEKLGDAGRQEAFRDDGATSTRSWLVERYGRSTSTARTLANVGEKAWDIPQFVGSLSTGDISLDKVRAVADVATPETDRQLCDQAKEYSVRELAEIARSTAELARTPSSSRSRSEHDGRFLRFNDGHRTISAQLPPESYAEPRASIEARGSQHPPDGETP